MNVKQLVAAAIVLIAAVGTTTTDAPRVVAVYPSVHRVPSNLLRVYIEFSAPMESDWARTHVRLLDDSNRVVEHAFLEMDDELWDPGRRRLTILFDPGRVKRGLRSHVEMGAPLMEGRHYRLVVDSGWKDSRGAPLVRSFTHDMVVGSFDGASPDPRCWTVSSTRVGTREPLRVRFDEPLDHALASRLITVVDSAGAPIVGRASADEDDTVWRFTPASPWRAGAHSLRVSTALEDLAGNSVGRLFDTDVGSGARASEARSGNVLVPISDETALTCASATIR